MNTLSDWIAGQPLFPGAGVLLALAVLLGTGFVLTRLARMVKIGPFSLPEVTGQIAAGILVGPQLLNLFDHHIFAAFSPVNSFAMGFIGFLVGTQLSFRRLHNAGKRILLVSFVDFALTTTGLWLVFKMLGMDNIFALLVAVIAAETSPSSILHVFKEKQAGGPFSKSVLASVAVNNVLGILAFYSVYFYLNAGTTPGGGHWLMLFTGPALMLFKAAILGGVAAFMLIWLGEKRPGHLGYTSLLLLALVGVIGLSEALGFSGILACLIMGVGVANYSRRQNQILSALKDVEREIFVLFFVLAGSHLDFGVIAATGVLGVVFLLSRLVLKAVGPVLGMTLAGAPRSFRVPTLLSFHPIAGVAVGLVLLADNLPVLQEMQINLAGGVVSGEALLTALILSAVLVFEIIGPLGNSLALQKAGECQQNRPRLLPFLLEENILFNLKATTREAALNELTDFYTFAHHLPSTSAELLTKSVHARENEVSTAVGGGLAIPHALIDTQVDEVLGVVGISRQGVAWDAPDGEAVHICVLVITPENHAEQHLRVLAGLAGIFGGHPELKDAILRAGSATEVFALLQVYNTLQDNKLI